LKVSGAAAPREDLVRADRESRAAVRDVDTIEFGQIENPLRLAESVQQRQGSCRKALPHLDISFQQTEAP